MGAHTLRRRRGAHARPPMAGRGPVIASISGICILGLFATIAVGNLAHPDPVPVELGSALELTTPATAAHLHETDEPADKNGNVVDADLPIIAVPTNIVLPTEVTRITLSPLPKTRTTTTAPRTTVEEQPPATTPATTTTTTTTPTTTATSSSAPPTTTSATSSPPPPSQLPSRETDQPPPIEQPPLPEPDPDPPVAPMNPQFTFGGVAIPVQQVGTYIKQEFDVATVHGVGDRPNNPDSDHPRGLALDFMVFDDKKKGDAINACLLRHKDDWGVAYTIWQEEDHYDHVHVSFLRDTVVRDLSC